MDSKTGQKPWIWGIGFSGSLLLVGVCSWILLDWWPFAEKSYYLRIFGLLGILVSSVPLAHFTLIARKTKKIRKMIWTGFWVLLVIGTLTELGFSFIPVSSGSGDSISYRLWHHQFWEENSLGFRDEEPFPRADSADFKVMVLGDSYVAGHGIKNPADRWPDQLAQNFPAGVELFNLGKNGSDTYDQLKTLQSYPITPDLLIFSHIPNDIEYFREKENPHYLGPLQNVDPKTSGFGGPLSPFSFALSALNSSNLNYLFHQESPMDSTQVWNGNNYLSDWLSRPRREIHFLAVRSVVNWAKNRGIPVFVVLWPESGDGSIDFSEEYVNQALAKFLRGEGVPFFDLYLTMQAIPFPERVVNITDYHPSAKAQKLAASEVENALREQGIWELMENR